MGILPTDKMNSQRPMTRGKDDRGTATCTPFVNKKRVLCPSGNIEVQAKLHITCSLHIPMNTCGEFTRCFQTSHTCIIHPHFYNVLQ